MRKLLSIALLLLLALPLVAPALGQSTQQPLLLCCRKGGAHHCMSPASAETPTARTRCGNIPNAAVASHVETWVTGDSRVSSTAYSGEPLKIREVEAGYRASFHRSRQKRGPPAVRLS